MSSYCEISYCALLFTPSFSPQNLFVRQMVLEKKLRFKELREGLGRELGTN